MIIFAGKLVRTVFPFGRSMNQMQSANWSSKGCVPKDLKILIIHTSVCCFAT